MRRENIIHNILYGLILVITLTLTIIITASCSINAVQANLNF